MASLSCNGCGAPSDVEGDCLVECDYTAGARTVTLPADLRMWLMYREDGTVTTWLRDAMPAAAFAEMVRVIAEGFADDPVRLG